MLNSMFQQYLGRNPTESESRTFSDELNTGRMDPMSLANFLQASAEYKRKQAPAMVNEYSNLLSGAGQKFAGDLMGQGYRTASAMARKQGRSFGPSMEARYMQGAKQVTNAMAPQAFGVTANMLANYYAGIPSQAEAGSNQALSRRYVGADRAADQANAMERLKYQAQMEQGYNDQMMKQAKENQWFGLAGGILQSAGSLVGTSMMADAYKNPGTSRKWVG